MLLLLSPIASLTKDISSLIKEFLRLFSLSRSAKSELAPPTLPDDRRIYVVGDIHGRLDCLDDLLGQILRDRIGFDGPVEYIFLGDLVDRGPDSRGVIQRLLDLSRADTLVRFLLGNHEEVMLMALHGDRTAMQLFDRIGGVATTLSYGINTVTYHAMTDEEKIETLNSMIPAEHLDFLSGFEDRIAVGDYRFVHAGIRPGIPFESQARSDLRWIRGEFLMHKLPFEGMIVHGHTVTDEVEYRINRIGIDTGAFKSGRLTCLVLERASQRLLQTALAVDPQYMD